MEEQKDQEAPDEPEEIQEEKPETKPRPSGLSYLARFKAWYLTHKKWTIPSSVLLLTVILAAIPITRYDIAALVIKKNFTVQVLDSETNTPVSGADVSMLLKTVQTDSNGKAVLPAVKVGAHSMLVHKKYYSDDMRDSTVPLLSQKNPLVVKLQATGRQTKVTVKNLISKAPLADVTIKAADTTAKTDKNGEAIIVLPTGTASQKATLSLSGYNSADATIKASDTSIIDNQLAMTPSGKVYFLSKLSGKIDVVKTNLDGSERTTVLAGTGSEEDQGTVLLASRDWKFLALLSRRAGSSPTLYLIDTSDDSLTTMDEGSASFNLVGWDGHHFIYAVTRNNINDWKTGKEALKSYDAEAKSITLLDQTAGSGSGQYDYVRETFGGEYVLNNSNVLYIKNWTSPYSLNSWQQIASKQATLNSIKADGSGHGVVKSFSLAPNTQSGSIIISEQVRSPANIELQFSDGVKDSFYTYSNGQVKSDPNATDENYYNASYSTYLLSPSGDSTFWSEPRDGKNTLFIGDQSGLNGKQAATLSDYFTYGWFSDNYLLVSKNSSELYIMSKDGSQPPVKISDYHKPLQNYNGYGGGYGGI